MEKYQIHNCDFRSLSKIQALHSLIIDPPYCAGGHQEAQRMKSAGTVGNFKGKEALFNDSLSTEGYKRMMRAAFGNSYTQEVYCFLDWRMYVPTYEVLEDAGFLVRNLLVWDKINPGLGATWRQQHELILWAIRPGMNVRGWGKGNVLSIKRSSPQSRNHPTEKPVELMRQLVSVAKCDLVVDLFMGSGSTGVAALECGKRFIGCEMSEKYFTNAESRLNSIATFN